MGRVVVVVVEIVAVVEVVVAATTTTTRTENVNLINHLPSLTVKFQSIMSYLIDSLSD